MGSEFNRLVVYRLARAVAADVYEQVVGWPSFDRWSVGMQLVRAIDSVGANVAEAMGRWHVPDRRRLLWVARGSLHETEHWMLTAEARGLLPPGSHDRLEEIARALNGLIKQPTRR